MQELLHYLESLSEDEYVLHGSPHRLSTIHPRQTLMDSGRSEYTEYAVYGTQLPDAAILYATIHERRDWWGWYIATTTDPPSLALRFIPTIKCCPKAGYIHVIPRQAFTKCVGEGLVFLAYTPVTPVEVHKVSKDMFCHLQDLGRVWIDED